MRIDVVPKTPHDMKKTLASARVFKEIELEQVFTAKSYWLHGPEGDDFKHYSQELLRDPVSETLLYQEFETHKLPFDYLIEISFKPGVTDNRARAVKQAYQTKFPQHEIHVATGDLYFLKASSPIDHSLLATIAENILGNSLIQRIAIYSKDEVLDSIPSPSFPKVHLTSHEIETINLDISDEELLALNYKKVWALSLDELKQIKNFFHSKEAKQIRKDLNLPESPTDIEMEVIAQTWSEHCKHKIFSSHISYTEDENLPHPLGDLKVKSIFKDFVFKATFDVQKKFHKDWLISVFKDNAGIVRFDEKIDHCFKVETHNSPSALDPYGGALTGILGVNRDILGCGLGAKPVANTNILCFAPPRYDQSILDLLPKKLKHPLTILKGVHQGIEEGGNKSGIPTVNGSFCFHDNFAGKPLVYCGTVGVLPQKIGERAASGKYHQPGDYIVICGGSVGADGIHGATFSSMELDDHAPATAVQIGDPFTQKCLSDFLFEAREKELYSALTDNGAGGLSSSVGEMAEHTNGAVIDVNKVPLKYPGLKPFEIVISESQERMTFAVPKEKLDAFLELAQKRNVNPAVIGNFTSDGYFKITQDDQLLASLDLDFLHNQLKPMELKAHYSGPTTHRFWHEQEQKKTLTGLEDKIHSLLKHDNIRSKEKLVRQYDHEVKGATVVKPFITHINSSPSDAGVIWSKLHGGSETGAVAIGHGIAPQYSHIDTYLMTQLAMDEAIRNVVATGANPDYIALCDNFCWPDPIQSARNPDGEYKLAQLVRSAKALYDTAMVYGTPFVSGKDSMKNDFIGLKPDGGEIKISCPPTLLISSLAKLDHVEDYMTSDFKMSGDHVFYIGPQIENKDYFSTLNSDKNEIYPLSPEENKNRFHLIHSLIKNKLIQSCHDISEGGTLIALIESCFANSLGFQAHDEIHDYLHDPFYFNEMSGAFIVSVSPQYLAKFKEKIAHSHSLELGVITEKFQLQLGHEFIDLEKCYQSWSEYEY
ncbi:MAG: phosphoribosylformylglycinamidine synthase [Halobacteriovoraceae bacterium]|nr:phosphoribosylformylglycinamidine synthase [Halobacteriovoraceae bacterium]|tara:strand:+ start:13608 stop:16586 length:2979 start_codon:yes stop_codon:yes gene_type:complete